MYKGWIFRVSPDKVEVENPRKKDDKFVYYLDADTSWENGIFKNCRKVEIDYSKYETERTIIRDYASDGSCYETKFCEGRIKSEVIYATQENMEEVMANLYATREIVGDPVVSVDPEDMNEVTIKINTMLPEIVTTFHSADGKYSEVVNTPPVYQPDKWITEDMATTYWHMLTGWDTEIQPVEAGRAVGPSDFTDMAYMHRRWFKGGPEVEQDFQEELEANGIKIAVGGIPVPGLQNLTSSPVGWLINQAKLWPAHTLTDILLYGVSPAYWFGVYILPKGLNPLSSPLMYVPVFAVYLWLTLGMYVRPMGQLRNSIKDIWYKEALLRMLAPVYVDAWHLAKNRQPLPWDATDAGDRKILPLKYLVGIAWRRELSRATAIFGIGYTTLLALKLGAENIPSPLATMAGLIFNWGFPFLNARLFETGIKRFYGYWTSFDDLAIYSCQLAGLMQKDVEVNGRKEKTIKVERDAADPAQRVITFYAKDEEQARHAVDHITGTTAGSYLARSANVTLGNVLKILGKIRIGEWRPIKRKNNIVFQLNDSARIIDAPVYEETEHGIKATLKVGINPDAVNFKYDSNNPDKRVWVNGDYYFIRDIRIQLGILRRKKEKK
jgi:hypothetical protein